MNFPGTWMTTSGSLVYRVVPKAACSTIGQIMFYSDHGAFFDGDIHDAKEGLHKWALEESRVPIAEAVAAHRGVSFTCVRNPYRRVLSSFFDKIAGVQRNGQRYRQNVLPDMTKKYGIVVDGDFDQIAMFRRFLLFARDTIRFRKPIEPDIHWSAQAGHLSTFVANGGRFDHIFHAEAFDDGMKSVLKGAETPVPVDLGAVPRFNESAGHGPKQAHPTEAYFDDLAQHLVREVYRKDFRLFGYDPNDPSRKGPKREIDLDEVHSKLA